MKYNVENVTRYILPPNHPNLYAHDLYNYCSIQQLVVYYFEKNNGHQPTISTCMSVLKGTENEQAT